MATKKTSKSNTPVFSVEQLEFLMSLVAYTQTTIHSTKEEFVAEVVKRDLREKIRNIANKQGVSL